MNLGLNSSLYASGRIRSSHSDVFRKKGVLENFAKFTGEHLSQSLFLNKVNSKFI